MNIDGKGDPRPKKLTPPIFSTDLEKGSSEGSLNESLPINEDLEIEYLNKTFEMKDFLIYLKDQIVTDPKDRELSMKDIGAQGLEVIDSLLKYYEQGKVILLTKKIENDSKILPRKEKETLAEYNQRVTDQQN